MYQPYLLALDLGTSSIGYVAFSIDEKHEPAGILDLGVRVFSDGRDPKTGTPLAVERRAARGIRRNRDRGQNRVRRLVKELIAFGLLPIDENERKSSFQSICPYESRSKAVAHTVDKNVLGRALFHLGRRRGFRSNRLADEAEDSQFKEMISGLREELEGQTLGQYLFEKMESNRILKQKGRPEHQKVVRFRKGETEFYADRQMYLDEFERIREVQKSTHLTDTQWEALKETIFWQYPLKPVPKGKCRFYPDEFRASVGLPLAQEFRILQEVNSLRYESSNTEHHLDDRQRKYLLDLLSNSKSVTFKALPKKKDQHKSPYFPADAQFNLDVPNRRGKLLGNSVLVDMQKPEHFGSLVNDLSPKEINNIIEFLIEPTKMKNERPVILEQDELEAWLQERVPKLDKQQVQAICRYRFKRETSSVSRKFMEQINPALRDTGWVYSKAVAHLEDDSGISFHHSHFETGEVFAKLPYYGKVMPESVWGGRPESDQNKKPSERDEDAYQYGKIANPTVHIALNQLRVVVNRIIDRIGNPPVKIHVELSRDLKNSKKARDRIEKANAENRKRNDRIRQVLETDFGIQNPSREDMLKVKLWEELGNQGFRCSIFSGKPISARQLFNGEVEIEHIVPFSRCYDDSFSNKTLAFRNENLLKGNKTPHEAFGTSSEYPYDQILKRALSAFGQSWKYDRFREGAFESFYGGDKGDMIARLLNDTRYISRKAAQYLGCLCHRANVVSVNGQMTAMLRKVWGLNQFKDRESGHYRDDHRHHIIDAFVVGLTSRSLIKQLNTRRSGQYQDHNDLYHFLKSRAPEVTRLRAELFEKCDGIIASYKPDHTKLGSMFNDTAYGIEQDDQGKQICVTRKALGSLSYEEVFRIRGNRVRVQLIQFLTKGSEIDYDTQSIRSYSSQLKKLVGNKKQFESMQLEFAKQASVKKVRIDVINDSVRPIPSSPYKGYARNSYAWCDIWQIPKKKHPVTGEWSYDYKGAFVAYADVGKYKLDPEFFRPIGKKGNPHPAAKKFMRLYKDDNIRLTDRKTGSESVKRIGGYSTMDNRLDIRENLYAGQGKQNFVSINVLFNKFQINKLRM